MKQIQPIGLRIGSYAILGLFSLLVIALLCPAHLENANAKTVIAVDDATTTGTVKVYPTISLALDAKVDLEVTPKSGGSFSQESGRLLVSTNNTTGYQILMNSVDGDTLEATSGATIDPITEDGQFTANTWGAYIGQVKANESDFKKVSTSNVTMKQTSSTSGVDEYQIAFGTLVDTTLPAGTYSRKVVVSAVTNPVTLSGLHELEYMQDMTPEICAASATWQSTDDEAQLIDSRDGKSYWVAKLDDGKCWMQQNLSLDLTLDGNNAAAKKTDGTKTVLTSDNTNIATGANNAVGYWNSSTGYAPLEMLTVAPSTVYQDNAKAYSWTPNNAGNIILTNPTEIKSCRGTNYTTITAGIELSTLSSVCSASYKTVTSSMTDGYTATNTSSINGNTYDAHYLIGNWYSWGAATAGTSKDATVDGAVASGSICPKGWRLPTTGEQAVMLTTYGADTTSDNGLTKIATAPLYSVRSGLINPVYGLSDGGYSGNYYSSTSSYNLEVYYYYYKLGYITTQSTRYRYVGLSVRCIAE